MLIKIMGFTQYTMTKPKSQFRNARLKDNILKKPALKILINIYDKINKHL